VLGQIISPYAYYNVWDEARLPKDSTRGLLGFIAAFFGLMAMMTTRGRRSYMLTPPVCRLQTLAARSDQRCGTCTALWELLPAGFHRRGAKAFEEHADDDRSTRLDGALRAVVGSS